MNNHYLYLLHLLKAHLWEQAPELPETPDWKELAGLARMHSVAGILGYMVMAYPICPEEDLREELRDICKRTMVKYSYRAALAEGFSQTLAEAEIDHILMKGYVLRDAYPVPELRTFGDIDLVIRREDREKSHALLTGLGYRVKTGWEPVYSYINDAEHYELHTELLETDVHEQADFREYFRDPWAHAREEGTHSWRFTPEYHFLYLLTHIAKHIHGSGAGIRMYLDIAAFLKRWGDTLDWNRVTGELEGLKLTQFSNLVLCAVEQWFAVRSPMTLTPVEPEVLADFLEFTMEGGIFGQVGRDSGLISLKDQTVSGKQPSRAATLAKRLFPDAKTIESRYTYLKNHPWLLPAAWVHRLAVTRGTWRQHLREAGNILTADASQAERIRRLYDQIGL